ncbi:myosin-binding protein 3 isoform X1 [Rosa chinensis]|uniref:myosin-binding protein 3 isoform X1 n=1 Tax=Rosa chinensis TaxID=74649 RepID=UPI000D095925|nr:myosin-binding protein 3 isoform X1 [Rosa chinensis]
MEANKFATMLKRKSPRFVLVLVYAVLEWVLLILLLLNSFFSYLITKFANYFGLKPPCPWCSSRVEHMLEPQKSYSDLVCEIHANEISKLGYCLNHKRLAESHSMCGNCFSSQPNCRENSTQSRMDLISLLGDKYQKKPSICSCCSKSFNTKLSPLSLEYAHKGDSNIEAVHDDNNEGTTKPDSMSVHSENGYEMETTSSLRDTTAEENCRNESKKLVHQSSNATTIEYCCLQEDHSLDTTPLPSESGMVCDLGCSLIPTDLIDFSTTIDEGLINSLKDQEHHDHEQGSFDSKSKIELEDQLSREAALLMVTKSGANTSNGGLKSLEMAKGFTDASSIEQVEKRNLELVGMLCDDLVTAPEAQTSFVDTEQLTNTKEPNDPPECEEERILAVISRNLSNTKGSHHAADQPQAHKDSSLPFLEISNVPAHSDVGTGPTGKSVLQDKTSRTKNAQEVNHFCMCSEPSEPEEERLVCGQNCINTIHYLYKKPNGNGECGADDGSVASVTNGGEPVTTVEELKAALKAESKALSALYSELEEERSASAVAANQTMAMITRLQEEKAAMQMEALQYQRMMEEQSEYDQEALQLLNELMNKMEREKQELEKELEIYQKKVLDYEEKEKIRVMSRIKYGSMRSRNSSASCSQSWDSDALSIDLNCEARDEDSSFPQECSNNTNNPDDAEALSLEEMALDCVKQMSILDNSLAGFQEERLSVLDQLKALEDRLVVLSENENCSQDANLVENCSNYSTKNIEENHDFSSPEEKQISDEKITLASMAKRLLPLLGVAAEDNETEAGLTNEKQVRTESIAMHNSVTNSELHDTRIAIEEEVDHVYERLQALEKSNLEKGMDLLQESLQHLRDLRDVELCIRNINVPVDEAAGN